MDSVADGCNELNARFHFSPSEQLLIESQAAAWPQHSHVAECLLCPKQLRGYLPERRDTKAK